MGAFIDIWKRLNALTEHFLLLFTFSAAFPKSASVFWRKIEYSEKIRIFNLNAILTLTCATPIYRLKWINVINLAAGLIAIDSHRKGESNPIDLHQITKTEIWHRLDSTSRRSETTQIPSPFVCVCVCLWAYFIYGFVFLSRLGHHSLSLSRRVSAKSCNWPQFISVREFAFRKLKVKPERERKSIMFRRSLFNCLIIFWFGQWS